MENNWDVVVLLHADGQYAPEFIEKIVEPIIEGNFDAVFGSRMSENNRALQDGMPLYKWDRKSSLNQDLELINKPNFF